MNDLVLVVKDEEGQRSIPTVWRETLSAVIEAFKDGDYVLGRGVRGVRPVSEGTASDILRNIQQYGATLISLPGESWETSACQWMGSYWDVLVDLFTLEEYASDLVLSARVYESDTEYLFEIHSVHVP